MSSKKAFMVLSRSNRVNVENVVHVGGAKPPNVKKRVGQSRDWIKYPNKGFLHYGKHPPAGFEGRVPLMPLQYRSPVAKWCKEKFDPSYVPLSVQKLQLLVDTGRLDPLRPVDLTELALTGHFNIDARQEHLGFMLKEEGMECMVTPLNLEVQYASEAAIAAVERAGGTVTTAYYDAYSLTAAIFPRKFFARGLVIPKRSLPPQRNIDYYRDPRNRGYLADPDLIAQERFVLSQKYGYVLPNLASSPNKELLTQRKDPRQVFHGLQPGWLVNLQDKTVLKPTNPDLQQFYTS